MDNPKTIEDLIDDFRKYPGVGYKTASRLAYNTITFSHEEIDQFIEHLTAIKTKLHRCPLCSFLYDSPECPLCNDENRDKTTLLVVSNPNDILLFENTHVFHGLYFTLDGLINPGKGKLPEDINIKGMLERINSNNISELILAFSPTIEGETTALYISKLLQNTPIKVSRLAYGIPLGSTLEYIDEATLSTSLKSRIPVLTKEKKYNMNVVQEGQQFSTKLIDSILYTEDSEVSSLESEETSKPKDEDNSSIKHQEVTINDDDEF